MSCLLFLRTPAALAALLAALSATACSHRSVEQVRGVVELSPAIRRVRLEVDNGTLDIAAEDPESPSEDVVYAGGVRRDASTAEGLARLEGEFAGLVGAPDPEDPATMVLRGPRVPAGVTGMIALEAGIRIPAGLEVEVVVNNNGHVTMVGRRAPATVRTRRGDLRFEDCHGGIDASTGAGVLIAYDHRGDLEVRSDHGDMQVFVAEAGEKLTLTTGKGTIQCHVPEELGFEVDARAEIGRIGNDFGLEVQKVGAYSAALVGRRGDGRTRIILRTASGHISLIPRKSD